MDCAARPHRLQFALESPGEVVATDNGDPTSLEAFHSSARNAFNGLFLVIVRAQEGEFGPIRLTASGNALTDGVVVLSSAGRKGDILQEF